MVFFIQCKKIETNYSQLWQAGRIVTNSGSGFAVEVNGKKYIATNAHVVKNSIYNRR
jgi:hypothetical protein